MSITKWWFNLNWSLLLWRRVKLPQKEASAYYLREEFLPQAVRPFCRQSWTSFISCVIQLFFKRKRQSTRDPQCKHRKQFDLLEENPSDDNNRTWRGFMNHISSSIKSIIIQPRILAWRDGLRIDAEASDDQNITNKDRYCCQKGCCYNNIWDYFSQTNK